MPVPRSTVARLPPPWRVLVAGLAASLGGCEGPDARSIVGAYDATVRRPDAAAPKALDGADAPPGDAIAPPREDAATPPPDAVRPLDAGAPDATMPPVEAPWRGGFVDLSAPFDGMATALYLRAPQGPGEDPEPIVGIAADLDEDGQRELIFAPTNENAEARTAGVFAFDRATERLRFRGLLEAGGSSARLNAVGALDLDDDGHVDLLCNRVDREIAWGNGGGTFQGPASLRGEQGPWRVPYRTLHVTDVDHDGWLDVIGGNGQCCVTCRSMWLYLRDGARRYADRSELFPADVSDTAWSILDGTVGGARVVMHVGQNCGNSDAPAFYREAGLDAAGYPRFEAWDFTPDDSYVRRVDPTWPSSQTASIQHWVPMGAALGDANGDGRDDVALALNFYPGLWLDEGRLPFTDATAPFGDAPHRAASGRPMVPWGIALVDVDRDGRSDLVAAHGNDHSAEVDPARFIGPQHTTLDWNAGGGRFTDMSRALGLERPGQYRSLYLDDLDGDGDADLVVGAHNDNPRVYVNHIDRGYHGFSMRLRGTSSNRLGIGARVRVTVRAGEAAQEFPVGAVGAPGVAADPIVFVGLGAATRAARVRVTWPSGTVQERAAVAADTLHVWEEPALFTVAPAGRHVAPGGAATLRVTARALDGTVRPDARIEVRVAYGRGAVVLRNEPDGARVATVAHPGAAGSSVLELRVDGAPAGVRPRIWWD